MLSLLYLSLIQPHLSFPEKRESQLNEGGVDITEMMGKDAHFENDNCSHWVHALALQNILDRLLLSQQDWKSAHFASNMGTEESLWHSMQWGTFHWAPSSHGRSTFGQASLHFCSLEEEANKLFIQEKESEFWFLIGLNCCGLCHGTSKIAERN